MPAYERPTRENLEKYTKFFPGADLESLKRTFKATTQLGTRGAVKGVNLRNRLTAPNPLLNIPRRNEAVATDTLYSDTPAVDDGSTAAQFFIGRKSHYRSVFGLGSSDKRFPEALIDQIKRYGAMDVLISDNAKAEIGKRTKEILRILLTKDYQSEPYNKNQQFSERGWRDTKTRTSNLLNMSGAPNYCWLLALAYVCFLQNHTAYESLNGRTPIEWLLGFTPDITVLLQFIFYEPVYYAKYDESFPGDTTELLGRFVRIAENIGNAMCFLILTEDLKVIARSVVRSARKGGGFTNRRANRLAPKLAPPTPNDDGKTPSRTPVQGCVEPGSATKKKDEPEQ